MTGWEEVFPAPDREIYRRAGFGKSAKWDGRPALVIIDALWSFIGHKPVDVLEAIKEYPTACGKAGWDGLDRISAALEFFRGSSLPVVYVCADGSLRDVYGATTRTRNPVLLSDEDAFGIPEMISPMEGEPIVKKTKASGFFRTPLDILLRRINVDTVVLAGCTTSGCIRASAVDSHSLGFETVLLSDAIWDRSTFSHEVSLFELSMKYASVATVDEASSQISKHANNRRASK
ncbi:MAG: isochorismatase family protein [Actinomycetota bacterium]|nr:MAG: isochorismatase family protein [Actinomycetota bacterium]